MHINGGLLLNVLVISLVPHLGIAVSVISPTYKLSIRPTD